MDWAAETLGSGDKPGVCMECAKYYWAREDEFDDEFESSLRSVEAERDELDFDTAEFDFDEDET